MKYILSTLDIIDKVSDELSIEFDKKDKYRSLVAKIHSYEEEVYLSEGLKSDIIIYLRSLKIQDEQILLDKISGIENGKFSDLTDSQLLKYLSIVLRTVTYLQKGDLLLLKYGKTIWNTGWHNFAKQCRGKVIDLNTRKVVVYPFNKFFNLNEVEETKEDYIVDLLNKAKAVYVTDKKDGSAIIITNYNGELIINTNGEFQNDQIRWAKKLLVEKYGFFYNNVPEGYTFIFELIHPENKIVLDYGNEESLYLLAIRDLSTLKLFSYPELERVAKKFHLDITESFEYTDLYTFIEKTQNETENIKEGWVFRVITETDDIMFKLKYQEYFRLSRIKNTPSLKKVYTLLQSGNLDDVLSVADSSIQDSVLSDVQVIFDYIEKFKGVVRKEVQELRNKYGFVIGNIDKDTLLKIVSDTKTNPFNTVILRAVKGQDIESSFDILPKVGLFEKYYKYTNTILGIEDDIWDEK